MNSRRLIASSEAEGQGVYPPKLSQLERAMWGRAQVIGRLDDVCFGSKADICAAPTHVRFTPESGHLRCTSPCWLWAKSRHRDATAYRTSQRQFRQLSASPLKPVTHSRRSVPCRTFGNFRCLQKVAL